MDIERNRGIQVIEAVIDGIKINLLVLCSGLGVMDLVGWGTPLDPLYAH